MYARDEVRVGVLMGGLSTERQVSLKSGAAVLAALERRGWRAVGIDVGRDLPQRLVDEQIDVAWVALHGRFGEDGCVQGLLELMGVPYTGCGVRASAVAMDKIATKRALRGTPGVRMARDVVLTSPDVPAPFLPCVVKPAVGGSTLGITIARDEETFAEALRAALALDPAVLVEELVVGDEVTAAVLDGEPLPVVRIVPASGFYDFAAKYTSGDTRYEVPAQLRPDATASAQAQAQAAYAALGCRGLCRADFIVPAEGEPVFFEINTIPGMTATSLSPMAAAEAGVGFDELVERLLQSARCMPSEV